MGKKHGGDNKGSNGFKSLGLSDEIYRGIVRMGFRNPTPVQRKSLPVILTGADSVVMARTGSGKTCAFCIPLLEKLLNTERTTHGGSVRGVILSPTRELSQQTLRVINKLISNEFDVKCVGIHGGEGMEKQFHLLSSQPDVVVATPGRLAHHLSEIPDFSLQNCCMCVLDEADRLLEMGFAQQIREICRGLPESCQKVCLSATMPKVLVEFTKSGFLQDPAVVRLEKEANVSEELRIAFVTTRSDDKEAALLHVLDHIRQDHEAHAATRTGLTLIFTATRHHVEYLQTLLRAAGHEAAVIYGTLDPQARRDNLHQFRTGKNSILITTDVAARGIDVPLIDHVVHYHFPCSPKLFVHRSGRAARAGRLGFCWGLVEPDEMPYMVELHLFLGRKLQTGRLDSTTGKHFTYTLDQMTPEMVHFGFIPESVLEREVETVHRLLNSELSGSVEADALRSLWRVCQNAMKQYRRTRADPSREAIRRSKELLEGERLSTGARSSNSLVQCHPLLKGMELVKQDASDSRTEEQAMTNAREQNQRQEFLQAVSLFRPKETIFEAFSTGGCKDKGVVSHFDKGRTATKNSSNSSQALTAMRQMRRQMRIARETASTMVVAGEDVAPTNPESFDEEVKSSSRPGVCDMSLATLQHKDFSRKRISKAQRKRMKMKNESASSTSAVPEVSAEKSTKAMRGADFRDSQFYMESCVDGDRYQSERSRKLEAAMQPNAGSSLKGSMGHAARIEEAMLDIMGDEKDELVKKQRMMRWDKSKRKYVKTTVGDELSGDSKSKRIRMENGQLVKADKLKLGELYEKWQKKTSRSIGRNGVFDNASGDHQRNGKHGVTDATRSVSSIRKEREKKQKMKLKNMKKSDRRRLENKKKGNKL